MRAGRSLLIGILVATCIASPAKAFRPRVQTRAYQVRLEGRLGPPRDSDKGTYDLSLAYKRQDFRLQLSELRVLSGGILSNQILNALAPYRPNVFLRADDETLRPLIDAQLDDSVEVTGYLRGRDLLVSLVRVVPKQHDP